MEYTSEQNRAEKPQSLPSGSGHCIRARQMIHKIYSGSDNASVMEKNATGTESSERGLVCSFNRVVGKPLTR